MNSRDNIQHLKIIHFHQPKYFKQTIFPFLAISVYLSSLSPYPDAQPIISPGMKILQVQATRNDDKLSAGYPLLWRVSQQHYFDWSKVTGYPRYKMSKDAMPQPSV